MTYKDPITKKVIPTKRSKVHDFYWHLLTENLQKVLEPLGFKVQESFDLGEEMKKEEWWKYVEEWHILDTLVTTPEGEKIAVETIVNETYGVERKKALKIRRLLNTERIIFFEPHQYLNSRFRKKLKNFYKKESYKDVEIEVIQKWKEEDSLLVQFWNEDEIRRLEDGENILKIANL